MPDNSVDLVFTDPPFGANINYSEMNILWEAWLGSFTDTTNEVIVNRFQKKDVEQYGELMTKSLAECYRVLRPGHWMILVFMNSSHKIWQSVRKAVIDSGFALERIDIFDKQHGTFKQFVSENTAGCDLLLHCRKTGINGAVVNSPSDFTTDLSVNAFLRDRIRSIPTFPYIHVQRNEEVDYRMLYSEFLSNRLMNEANVLDFSTFRSRAESFIKSARLVTQ